MNSKKFNWKTFISLNLAISFIIIFISGTILFIAPPGRVAHWVNWKIFGLLKEEWQSIHTIFSYTFAIFSIFHLFSINWKQFISYIKNKNKKGLNRKKEIYLSIAFSLFIMLTAVFNFAPSSSFMEMGETIKNNWENKNEQAPIPHSEKLSLLELSTQLKNMNIEQITTKLKKNNILFNNTNIQTLTEIGLQNNLSPYNIYSIITKNKSFEKGTGLGKKTIEEITNEESLNINFVIQKLKAQNIIALKSQTLKEVSQSNKISTKKIYEIITSK